ncbi:MAG: hypothetical protein F6K37_41030 [Moorea sp. SIO4E2]|uniref:hypothetical protein n=1 Tax=Moorena sp. SIO4E2 TaxID=2607826 RepID=UPI0013B67ED4|nr:hypothetical protein [Moorena sp. SIO4E2]NEQ12020.1 hypothetical protein [Moorena sp. SIO4E2]
MIKDIFKDTLKLPKLLLTDYRLPITDYRLPIPDYRFPIPDSRFPIPDSRFNTNELVKSARYSNFIIHGS